MIIAKQKRQENIAEYILYMWQLEDMIRAYSFDVSQIAAQFDYPQHIKKEIFTWYSEMALAMREEGIETSGHLMQLKELVQELSDLNITLLQKSTEKQYHELFNDALPYISEIIQKSNNTLKNEIDACLTGLYGLFMLRLENKQVSAETQKAMQTFSKFLAVLSQKFHAMERGELDI